MTTLSVATLPRSIYIEPTSRCNELCQQCPRTLLSREDDRDLSFDKFRYIVDQFPVLERVVLHGLGEPLLNKDLPLMVRYLKERGTYVLFNSNGIALTARRGQALIDAGLDEYRLSMDGATRVMPLTRSGAMWGPSSHYRRNRTRASPWFLCGLRP